MPQPNTSMPSYPTGERGDPNVDGGGDFRGGVDLRGGVDFRGYVAARRPALLRFATVLCGQAWLADDLVSDVLGRAYERWDRIGGLSEPHAYVRRMIVNDYLSWRRRLARTSPRSDLEPVLRVVGDGADVHAERDAMMRRLEALPRKQRAAVVLRYYAGLGDPEIGEHLGCTPSTVRSQISRALVALRLDATEPPRPFSTGDAR